MTKNKAIKRTRMADAPRSAAWVHAPYGDGTHAFADVAFDGDYPTHSPVLGPDGAPLAYEPRSPLGFDLRSKK